MKTEIVKEGSNWNDSKVGKKMNGLTDDNSEFKFNYRIEWKITLLTGVKNEQKKTKRI